MSRKNPLQQTQRRQYDEEFKAEAVQMLMDGHSANSVAERLGISNVNLLDRWKQKYLKEAGPATEALDSRVRQLELELQPVQRERDVLKKALEPIPKPYSLFPWRSCSF